MIEREWYLLFLCSTCISSAYSMQVPYVQLPDEIELQEIVVSNPATLSNRFSAQNLAPEPLQVRRIISTKNGNRTIEEFENIYRTKVSEKNSLIKKRQQHQMLIGTTKHSFLKYGAGCLCLVLFIALALNERMQLNIRWDQFLAQSNLFIVLPILYYLLKIPKGAYQNFLKYKMLKRQLPHLDQTIETYQNHETQFSPEDDFYWQCTKVITCQQT